MASPQDALRVAVKTMRDALTELEDRRTEIETQAEQLRASIRALEKQIGQESPEGGQKSRRPRGQNLYAIQQFFADRPGKGFTVSVIAEAVAISPSSAQAALKGSGGLFLQGEDGLWRAKEAG